MASFFSSAIFGRSLMLTATAQRQRMVAVWICFLLLAGSSSAHSELEEHQSCGKKELVLYEHENRVGAGRTVVMSASPSRNGTIEFGTINVVANVLRKGLANDSPPLGFAKGLVVFEKDLSISLAFAFELTTPGCTGTLTAQGVLDPNGNGEIVITGGSGTYRWARGYVEVLTVSTDPADVVFKNTVHLKYV